MEMLKVGGKAADIALLIMAQNGNIVLSKDLHNLKESSKMTESEAAELQRAINAQIKADGGKSYFNFVQSQDGTEFYGLFYQNKRMKSLFTTNGILTIVDGTYKLNKKNFPVINFEDRGFRVNSL